MRLISRGCGRVLDSPGAPTSSRRGVGGLRWAGGEGLKEGDSASDLGCLGRWDCGAWPAVTGAVQLGEVPGVRSPKAEDTETTLKPLSISSSLSHFKALDGFKTLEGLR